MPDDSPREQPNRYRNSRTQGGRYSSSSREESQDRRAYSGQQQRRASSDQRGRDGYQSQRESYGQRTRGRQGAQAYSTSSREAKRSTVRSSRDRSRERSYGSTRSGESTRSYDSARSGSYSSARRGTATSSRRRERSAAPARDRDHSANTAAIPAKDNPIFKIGLATAMAVVVILSIYFLFFVPKQAQPGANAGSSLQGSGSNAPIVGPLSNTIVMTLEGSKDTYVLKGEEYLEPGCRAIDKSSGTITTDMQITGNVDTSKAGDYEVTYTATMPDGTSGQATRTVHVVDSFEENAESLPVLMYHYVYTADEADGEMDGNYILDTKLRDQLKYLKDNDYYYPSFQEIRAFAEGTHTLPAKSVVLTFDDGEEGFLKHGVPLFNEFQIPATSFVICNDMHDQLVQYASEYVQFQSHTYDMHRDGTSVGQGGVIHAMTQDEILDDIEKSKQILGGSVQAVAYPYGDNNETAWAALDQAGVECAFTVRNARIHPGDNPMALNRVRISGEYLLEGFEYLVTPNGGEQ